MQKMRTAWFEHVRKTRKRLSKGKKDQVSHRVAMQHASSTWPKEKEKALRAQKRASKKLEKVKKTQSSDNVSEKKE